MIDWVALDNRLRPHGLMVMGTLHNDGNTLALVGADRHWWDIFQKSVEFQSGQTDPIDTWSKRTINKLAERHGAETLYPSDGPPYLPFIEWSLATKRFSTSPVGMLVHDVTGMMVSIRGALVWDKIISVPTANSLNPCIECAQPCVSQCPVGALGADKNYDVGACHHYLDTAAGKTCLTQGCAVRRACPVSQSFGRPFEQSAFHMKAFHPNGA